MAVFIGGEQKEAQVSSNTYAPETQTISGGWHLNTDSNLVKSLRFINHPMTERGTGGFSVLARRGERIRDRL